MSTEDDKKEKALILKIRKLAGQIGHLQKNVLPGSPDAEEYDFQVQVGLADAVVEILDTDVAGITRWFAYCLIRYGIEPDDRIAALLDALVREVDEQIEFMEDDDEESDDKP